MPGRTCGCLSFFLLCVWRWSDPYRILRLISNVLGSALNVACYCVLSCKIRSGLVENPHGVSQESPTPRSRSKIFLPDSGRIINDSAIQSPHVTICNPCLASMPTAVHPALTPPPHNFTTPCSPS
ncbi:hypothetical protein K470DRAFT_164987 [Piedraia hortae CBS 480.64]|uniref:Uncharacterized protein n=1 Tax=Piedraia hortae CBS 480.64 TaxID=1314780 RepID=A0A6A7C6P7_9PEZI|nr:hypothetical protein K470DRAFT_164987 [Piedraia hortae CBS 480.64]